MRFYLLDISYSTDETGSPVIKLFGKSENKLTCILDKSFEPYFYAVPKKLNEDLIKKIKNLEENDFYVTKTEIKELNNLNKKIKVIKVFVNHPKSVPIISKLVNELAEIEEIREFDIPFCNRYLIDKDILSLQELDIESFPIEEIDGITYYEAKKITKKDSFLKNPKILAFDIETYSKGNYSVSEEDPIIMLSLYGEDFKKVLTWKKFKTKKPYIEFTKNEAELIERFKELVEEYNPDIISGYFSDGFDFPYLNKRAKKYNIILKFNSRILKINKKGNINAKIIGLVHIDIFKFIRNIMAGSLDLDSFDLSSVSEKLLDEKKLDVEITTIGVIWDIGGEDLEKYCEYNLKDSELVFKLCKNLFVNIEEIVKLTNRTLFDVCRMTYSQIDEAFLIKKSYEFKELIPNKPTNKEIAIRRLKTYEGAFVFQPTPGLYENIVVMDFRSLYPSLIIAKNICISSLSLKKGFYKTKVDNKNIYFSKKEGFIPKVIKEILLKRAKFKKISKGNKLLEARSYALKTIMNSIYGYYAYFRARWYCFECAQAITSFGREYIQDVISKAKNFKFNVIYGDTDSVIISLENKTKKDALNFLKIVNENLPSLMELELEDFYKRGIFVMKKSASIGAKKKYALISEKNKIKVRGFETRRRDWSLIARETQIKILEIILKENNPDKAFKYMKDIISKIRNKKIEKEKMIIQTQLKKDIKSYALEGPHVTVAREMEKEGLTISPGMVIRYIVTEGKGLIRSRAKVPEKAENYDSEYYIKNQILPSVEKIFEALGYGKENLLERKEQMKLGDF